jgi:hypothetical protein
MEDTHISYAHVPDTIIAVIDVCLPRLQLTELEQQQNEHQSPGQSEPARALIFLEEATQSWPALDAVSLTLFIHFSN